MIDGASRLSYLFERLSGCYHFSSPALKAADLNAGRAFDRPASGVRYDNTGNQAKPHLFPQYNAWNSSYISDDSTVHHRSSDDSYAFDDNVAAHYRRLLTWTRHEDRYDQHCKILPSTWVSDFMVNVQWYASARVISPFKVSRKCTDARIAKPAPNYTISFCTILKCSNTHHSRILQCWTQLSGMWHELSVRNPGHFLPHLS